MQVYFDNAATTPIDKEALQAMLPYLKEHFGNPSSIHSYGREARNAIELARKAIARTFNTSPSEIYFTSCGTEANNMILNGSVKDLGVKNIITSRIEHDCILRTVEHLEKEGKVKLQYVNLKKDGHVDLEHLEELLKQAKEKTMVSLMHANNEIGNLLNMKKAAKLCEEHDAWFHSDTVQTIGHYFIDLQKLSVHFIAGSAHKFHGPKGAGFLYINHKAKVNPMILGGAQERNMRAGTENVAAIVGMEKALEVCFKDLLKDQQYIQELKTYMMEQLKENIPGVLFNGDAEGKSFYKVLNVSFPSYEGREMLLFNLDIAGIAVSAGSACSSGAGAGSHVLRGINADMQRPSIRFSFSRFNTKEEIDYTVAKLKEIIVRSAVGRL